MAYGAPTTAPASDLSTGYGLATHRKTPFTLLHPLDFSHSKGTLGATPTGILQQKGFNRACETLSSESHGKTDTKPRTCQEGTGKPALCRLSTSSPSLSFSTSSYRRALACRSTASTAHTKKARGSPALGIFNTKSPHTGAHNVVRERRHTQSLPQTLRQCAQVGPRFHV